jgi:uncharacterized protein YrrD
MQIKDGADVYTPSGKHVGSVERVVLDPRTKEVSHIVVKKGILFTSDKVVPISLIGPAEGDRLMLREDAGDLERLPDFESTHYLAAEVPVDQVARKRSDRGSIYWYPPTGADWPTGSYDFTPSTSPLYVTEKTRNIPEGTIALKEGAHVISSDGEHVGNIERVFTKSPEEQITHLLISRGLILKEEKLVPVAWVASVEDESVHLAVSANYVEGLPEYEMA